MRDTVLSGFRLALVLCLCTVLVMGQLSPEVRLHSIHSISDGKGPYSLEVEFEIVAGFVVSEAKLHYRPHGSVNYEIQRMTRNEHLRFGARIPYYDAIEYFVELRPERGAPVFVSSADSPRSQVVEDVPTIKEKRKRSKTAIIVVAVVVGVVLAIFGINRTKRDPEER